MKWLRHALGLVACASMLVCAGCADQVEPPAEITGVESGASGSAPATVQDYAKRQGGMQPGAYQGQAGYPGAKK